MRVLFRSSRYALLFRREEAAGAQRLAHIDAAAQELQHHLAGGGFSRAPPGQRALQPEQPVEPVAVGGIENGLRHHVLQYLLVLQQEDPVRSEEHTSELQSLMRISYAVFCLQKKNK